MSTDTAIQLPDGARWPDPCVDPRDLPEPQATHYRAAVLSAYRTLAAHPAGTESAVRALRALRRAVKERP